MRVGGRRRQRERTRRLRAERLGSTEAGPKAYGCGSWLILRSSFYCISRRRDTSSSAMNVKVISVGGRGLLCAEDYSGRTWRKCQIGSRYLSLDCVYFILQTSWVKPLLFSKLLLFSIYILLPSTFSGPSPTSVLSRLEDVPLLGQ